MRKALVLFLFLITSSSALLARNTDWVIESQTIFSLTLIGLIVLIGIFYLAWSYSNLPLNKPKFFRFAWQFPLVKFATGILVLVAAITFLMPREHSKDPYKRIEYAKMRRLPVVAARAYRELADRFPLIAEYHYGFVSAYYERDEWGEDGEVVAFTTEELSPIRYYQELLHRTDPGVSDMARLGLGMCEYFEEMRVLATKQFMSMGDTNTHYRNLFLARIHHRRGDYDEAMRLYQAEFDLGGARQQAVDGMAAILFVQRDDLERVRSFVSAPEYEGYVPRELMRFVYIKDAHLFRYLGNVMAHWADNVTWIGLLGALLGVLAWVFFLRRVDLYKKQRWLSMIGMLVLGGLLTFFALPLYDIVRYEFGFDLSQDGNFFHDFLYCVFGIGLIEELVKIVPLLLFLQFTKLIRGPMDYLIYASLSALGFAFVENLMYFDSGHISIMHSRVLVACLGHMAMTATVAMGLILARYRYGGRYTIPLFLAFYMIAALTHGIYDFWLLNPSARAFAFLAYVVFVYETFQYASYVNNCLNNSPIFRGRTVLDTNRLAVFLLISLISVLLFEYVALSAVYGPGIGNFSLVRSMGMGSFLMFFVVLNLSHIDVVQGEWFVVRFWNFSNRLNYNKAIGRRIRLLPTSPKSVLSRSLPASGEIIARIKLQKDNRYFLLAFDQPVDLLGHKLEYVLLKARDKETVIEPGHNMEVSVVAFRDKEALVRRQKKRSDFKVLDFAILR